MKKIKMKSVSGLMKRRIIKTLTEKNMNKFWYFLFQTDIKP